MERFLSCDWGISSFRLRIVQTLDLKIIAEEKSNRGIANCFELWKQSGKTEDDRLDFYLDIIQHHIKNLEKNSDTSLKEMPLIISGMASSTIGMVNLPYKELPFSADGSDLGVERIQPSHNFSNEIIIISGARTDDDVIRGEETQLIGSYADNEEQLFVFPGTHSKHIIVKNGKAVDIKTYMTGEFFELLSQRSILSRSVEEGNNFKQRKNSESFKNGVMDSVKSNLLHTSFRIRTNDLFGKLTKEENYYYLSGLLIGTEVKELINTGYLNISLVSDETLSPYYETAFDILNKENLILKIQNAAEALVRGQFQIFVRLFSSQ